MATYLNTLFKIPCQADEHVQGCSLRLYLAKRFHIFLTEPQVTRPGMEGENYFPRGDSGNQEDHPFGSSPPAEACLRGLEWWGVVRVDLEPSGLLRKWCYFPISFWQPYISGRPGPASFEQVASVWSHCVGQDRSQAWHPAGSGTAVRFPGVSQHLPCTRWRGRGFLTPVSTLAPGSTSTPVVTFSSPSRVLAGLLPPA